MRCYSFSTMNKKFARQLLALLLCFMLPLYSIAASLPFTCQNMVVTGQVVSMEKTRADMMPGHVCCQQQGAGRSMSPDGLCKASVACNLLASVFPETGAFVPFMDLVSTYHPVVTTLLIDDFPQTLLHPPRVS